MTETFGLNSYAEFRMLEAFEEDVNWPPNELLIRHGEWFEPRIRPEGLPVGEKRYCFRNAFRLASERPDLRYVEGYGVSVGFEGMPSRHAWCVDADKRVLDPTPTWADPDRPPIIASLRGIPLPLDFVRPYVDHDDLHCGTLEQLSDDIDKVTAALRLPPLR